MTCVLSGTITRIDRNIYLARIVTPRVQVACMGNDHNSAMKRALEGIGYQK